MNNIANFLPDVPASTGPLPPLFEDWVPTEDDIQRAISALGYPSFDLFKFDHLPAGEVKILKTAIEKVKSYVRLLKDVSSGPSLILIASHVDNDRTGYGCGKTTLAKIVQGQTAKAVYSKQFKDSLSVSVHARFFTSRDLMHKFDAPNFELATFLGNLPNVVIIDDVGREGNLKYEKRDPEIQQQEKRDRYYSIINYFYERKKSLVITSNLTSRELADYLGGAAWSRLMQMTPSEYRVNMTGVSDIRPALADREEWF